MPGFRKTIYIESYLLTYKVFEKFVCRLYQRFFRNLVYLNITVTANVGFRVLSERKARSAIRISEIGDDIAFDARITQKQLPRFIVVVVIGISKRANLSFNQGGIRIGFRIAVE